MSSHRPSLRLLKSKSKFRRHFARCAPISQGKAVSPQIRMWRPTNFRSGSDIFATRQSPAKPSDEAAFSLAIKSCAPLGAKSFALGVFSEESVRWNKIGARGCSGSLRGWLMLNCLMGDCRGSILAGLARMRRYEEFRTRQDPFRRREGGNGRRRPDRMGGDRRMRLDDGRRRRDADDEVLLAQLVDKRVSDLRRVRRTVPALEVIGDRGDRGAVESAGRLRGIAADPLEFDLRVGDPLVDRGDRGLNVGHKPLTCGTSRQRGQFFPRAGNEHIYGRELFAFVGASLLRAKIIVFKFGDLRRCVGAHRGALQRIKGRLQGIFVL